jgi:hypothetical protein
MNQYTKSSMERRRKAVGLLEEMVSFNGTKEQKQVA